MKTPEEWANKWREGGNFNLEYFIQQAQDEAYHEGQLAGLQLGKETALKTIDEVFSKPAERSESV